MSQNKTAEKFCPLCKDAFAEADLVCPKDGAMLVQQDRRIGQTIDGKFALISVLGQGGAGVVYKAEQTGFDRCVAVKIMKVLHETDAASVLRFQREAQVLSQLHQVNLAAIYGFGVTSAGEAYIVYELIEGQRLAEITSKTDRPSFAYSIELMKQLCAALTCMHSHGVVHRDLKPSNLMVTKGPEDKPILKVLDFGSAKLMPKFSTLQQRLTLTGQVLGSINYMSPEQAMGEDLDERTDIYSAGRILADLTQTDLKSTPEIDAVIEKATKTKRAERYQTAEEFAADLSAITVGQKGPTAAAKNVATGMPGKRSQRQLILISAAATCAALVATLAMLPDNRVNIMLSALNVLHRVQPARAVALAQTWTAENDASPSARQLRATLVRWLTEEDDARGKQGHSQAWADAALAYIESECRAGDRPAVSSLAEQLNSFYEEGNELDFAVYDHRKRHTEQEDEIYFRKVLNRELGWTRLTKAYYGYDYAHLMMRSANLGNVQMRFRDYDEAVTNFTAALEYEKRTKIRGTPGAECMLHLVELGGALKRPALTAKYSELLEARAGVEKGALVRVLYLRAEQLSAAEKRKDAITLLKKATTILESGAAGSLITDPNAQMMYVTCLTQEAECCLHERNYAEAERLSRKYLDECRHFFEYDHCAPGMVSIVTESLLQQHKRGQARAFLNGFRSNKDKLIRATALLGLARCEVEEGNFDQALKDTNESLELTRAQTDRAVKNAFSSATALKAELLNQLGNEGQTTSSTSSTKSPAANKPGARL